MYRAHHTCATLPVLGFAELVVAGVLLTGPAFAQQDASTKPGATAPTADAAPVAETPPPGDTSPTSNQADTSPGIAPAATPADTPTDPNVGEPLPDADGATTPPDAENGTTTTTDPGTQHYIDGVKALNAGDFQTAESLLEQAVQARPRNAQVRFALAMAYLKTRKNGKAWFHLRKAVLFNGQHQRAVRYFLALWRAIERSGSFNVGKRSADVRAAAGEPDHIKDSDSAKLWYYGFMAVSFADDQVEAVVDMRGLDPNAPPSTDVLSYKTDDRQWQVGYRFRQRNQEITSYFLPDQTPQQWTERLVIQRLKGAAAEGRIAPQTLNQLEAALKKVDPDAEWNVIDQSDRGVLYEWRVTPAENRTPQHGLARLIAGKTDGHRISYVAQLEKLSPERRNQWLELLKQAKVVTNTEQPTSN